MTAPENEETEFGEYGTLQLDQEPQKMPIKKVFLLLGLAFSLSIVLMNVFSFFALPLIEEIFPSIFDSSYFLFALNTLPLMFLAMPVVFAITNFIPTVESHYKSRISFLNFIKIVVVSYFAMTIINMASQLINSLITQLTGAHAINPLESMQTSGVMPIFIFAVILSPIIEEIMFRFVIINKLRTYGSGVSIFVSAFIFGLYHGNLFQMFYAFAIGAVLAAVYYKTGRLTYSIALHIAINFIGSILPIGILSEKKAYMLLCGMLLIAALVSGLIFGIIALCKTDFSRIKNDFMPSYYIKPFLLNAGIIIYILIILAIVALQFAVI